MDGANTCLLSSLISELAPNSPDADEPEACAVYGSAARAWNISRTHTCAGHYTLELPLEGKLEQDRAADNVCIAHTCTHVSDGLQCRACKACSYAELQPQLVCRLTHSTWRARASWLRSDSIEDQADMMTRCVRLMGIDKPLSASAHQSNAA